MWNGQPRARQDDDEMCVRFLTVSAWLTGQRARFASENVRLVSHDGDVPGNGDTRPNAGLCIEWVVRHGAMVRIYARVSGPATECPSCGSQLERVRSQWCLSDAAVSGAARRNPRHLPLHLHHPRPLILLGQPLPPRHHHLRHPTTNGTIDTAGRRPPAGRTTVSWADPKASDVR
jgi:hypothetical protein